MKVLNLYAGIGGNRKLWTDVEVTAVELDPNIAKIYQDFFPDDKVIVGDAHQYLLEYFAEYDFIWSSPPCPSHSKLRLLNNIKLYPDMTLYQEIIFLKYFCKSLFVVENVKPYYEPLISCQPCGRHLLWSNFNITDRNKIKNNPVKYWTYEDYENHYDIRLKQYQIKGFDRRKILRNCVEPKLGLHILNCAREIYEAEDVHQIAMEL
jgi:DNA (cytosine-5)-methyltransferase 1